MCILYAKFCYEKLQSSKQKYGHNFGSDELQMKINKPSNKVTTIHSLIHSKWSITKQKKNNNKRGKKTKHIHSKLMSLTICVRK